jgi:hypothetical protein
VIIAALRQRDDVLDFPSLAHAIDPASADVADTACAGKDFQTLASGDVTTCHRQRSPMSNTPAIVSRFLSQGAANAIQNAKALNRRQAVRVKASPRVMLPSPFLPG